MCLHNIFEVYCSDTGKEPYRDFFTFDIFFQQGVFLASKKGKSRKGRDLANKEGEEARQHFPVSDILIQWPLCVTKHYYATT
jgi:hypothetical protein